MNWADCAIILVLAVSGIISLRRGLVRELLSLAVWGASFLIATIYAPVFSVYLESYTDTPSAQQMAAFAILFVTTLLSGSVIIYLLSSLVKVAGLSNVDRFFGVVFGCARGVLIILVIVIYLPLAFPIDQDLWWQESWLIPYFLSMEDYFYQVSKPVLNLLIQSI